MSLGLTCQQVERLRSLPREQQIGLLAGMSGEDLLRLDCDFDVWANAGQKMANEDGWRTWLMMAGRGFGKTRAGAEWVLKLALGRRMRIALVGATMDEARAIMVEGASGILTLARRARKNVRFEPGRNLLRFPNGSEATLYSGDSPDGLRGPEHEIAWCDELAKWRRGPEAWDNLQMGLRMGARPRALVTTTPRSGKLLEAIRAGKRTVVSGGRTTDNVTLSPEFVEAMVDTYGGTRLGRQELDGELMAEAEGSLFPRALLEAARTAMPARCAIDRVIVAVDPPASATGDACGIVVAGRIGETIVVLEDASVEGCRPERWAATVAAVAASWAASHVVAEANNGGEMVASVLRAADSGLRVKLVHAARGKVARAEPVAVRMERGQLKLAGMFPELEAELNAFVGGGYDGSGSPDRADACVWAVTSLAETRSGVPRVWAF